MTKLKIVYLHFFIYHINSHVSLKFIYKYLNYPSKQAQASQRKLNILLMISRWETGFCLHMDKSSLWPLILEHLPCCVMRAVLDFIEECCWDRLSVWPRRKQAQLYN